MNIKLGIVTRGFEMKESIINSAMESADLSLAEAAFHEIG